MAGIPIGVDCQFEVEGIVQVRRLLIDGQWIGVGQGRQWVDRLGRHVLVMLPGDEMREILLNSHTMNWSMLPAAGRPNTWLV